MCVFCADMPGFRRPSHILLAMCMTSLRVVQSVYRMLQQFTATLGLTLWNVHMRNVYNYAPYDVTAT